MGEEVGEADTARRKEEAEEGEGTGEMRGAEAEPVPRFDTAVVVGKSWVGEGGKTDRGGRGEG